MLFHILKAKPTLNQNLTTFSLWKRWEPNPQAQQLVDFLFVFDSDLSV